MRVSSRAALALAACLIAQPAAADSLLRDILGDDRVEALRGSGRYRRDVY